MAADCIFKKSIILPASVDDIWEKLQQLQYLQYVAAPLASFTPVDGKTDLSWREGRTYHVHFKLYGILPMGVHTIHIEEMRPYTIYSKEHNKHVLMWNHRIRLRSIDSGHTEYSDEVTINAGNSTDLVFFWAKHFFSHRQKRWMKVYKGRK